MKANRTMQQRLFLAFLLMATMAVQTMAEDWALKIAGVQVTDDNHSWITGTGISTSGVVACTYDGNADMYILKFSADATITYDWTCIEVGEDKNLTIDLCGRHVTLKSNYGSGINGKSANKVRIVDSGVKFSSVFEGDVSCGLLDIDEREAMQVTGLEIGAYTCIQLKSTKYGLAYYGNAIINHHANIKIQSDGTLFWGSGSLTYVDQAGNSHSDLSEASDFYSNYPLKKGVAYDGDNIAKNGTLLIGHKYCTIAGKDVVSTDFWPASFGMVTGSNIKGTVMVTTNTIYLTNATITATTDEAPVGIELTQPFNIVASGANTITAKKKGILTWEELTVTSGATPGNLTVESTDNIAINGPFTGDTRDHSALTLKPNTDGTYCTLRLKGSTGAINSMRAIDFGELSIIPSSVEIYKDYYSALRKGLSLVTDWVEIRKPVEYFTIGSTTVSELTDLSEPITGEGISGTVTYDADSKTLTLKDVGVTSYTKQTIDDRDYYLSLALLSDVSNVNLVGTNSFKHEVILKDPSNSPTIRGKGTGAMEAESINLTGQSAYFEDCKLAGDLIVRSGSVSFSRCNVEASYLAIAIDDSGNASFNNSTLRMYGILPSSLAAIINCGSLALQDSYVEAGGAHYGYYGQTGSSIDIYGGTVKLRGTESAARGYNLNVYDAMTVTEPTGAAIVITDDKTKQFEVLAEGGSEAVANEWVTLDLPASEKNYYFSVGSTGVTGLNCSDIRPTELKKGTVSYDPATRTLTLDNVEMENGSIEMAYSNAVSTLLLKGDNTMTGAGGSGYAVSTDVALVITSDDGKGTLTIGGTGVQTGISTGYGSLTIDACHVSVEADDKDYGKGITTGGEPLAVVNGASLRAKGAGEYGGSIVNIGKLETDDMDITAPANAEQNETDGTVELDGVTVRDWVVIEKVYLMIGRDYVTAGNCGDIKSASLTGGTAAYDPETKTLTLDNATIGGEDYGILFGGGDLTIVVKGNCTVSGDAAAIATRWGEKLAVVAADAGSSLAVSSAKGHGIYFPGETAALTLENTTIDTEYVAISASGSLDLTVKGTNTVKGGEYGITAKTLTIMPGNEQARLLVTAPGFAIVAEGDLVVSSKDAAYPLYIEAEASGGKDSYGILCMGSLTCESSLVTLRMHGTTAAFAASSNEKKLSADLHLFPTSIEWGEIEGALVLVDSETKEMTTDWVELRREQSLFTVGALTVTDVTDASKPLTGEGISGTVSYDAATQTLTLSGAEVTTATDGHGLNIMRGVTAIDLQGNNSVSQGLTIGSGNSITVDGHGSASLTGKLDNQGTTTVERATLVASTVKSDGSLTVSNSNVHCSEGLELTAGSLALEHSNVYINTGNAWGGIHNVDGSLSISDCFVMATGKVYGYLGSGTSSSLTIDGSTVRLEGSLASATGYNLNLYGDVELTAPDDATVAEEGQKFEVRAKGSSDALAGTEVTFDVPEAKRTYAVYVGSTQVTGANKDDVKTAELKKGKVSYDPMDRVLTLDNAQIELGSIQIDNYAVRTLLLVGNNSIVDGGAAGEGLMSMTELTIKGNGQGESKLTLGGDMMAQGLTTMMCNLTIDSCAVSIDSNGTGLTTQGGKLILTHDARLSVKGSGDWGGSIMGVGSIVTDGYITLSAPAGAEFVDANDQVELDGDIVKSEVVYEAVYPLFVGTTQVTASNRDNIEDDDVITAGKVSFDPDSQTLTLSGATLNTGGIKVTDKDMALTVNTSGTSKIKNTNVGIETEGKLTLTTADTKSELTIDVVKNAITAKTLALKGATIASPAGAAFDAELGTVTAGGKTVRELTIGGAMPGDVNSDGVVNITDVTMTISHILGQNPAGFNAAAADVSGDSVVNILDVTTIIDMILGK